MTITSILNKPRNIEKGILVHTESHINKTRSLFEEVLKLFYNHSINLTSYAKALSAAQKTVSSLEKSDKNLEKFQLFDTWIGTYNRRKYNIPLDEKLFNDLSKILNKNGFAPHKAMLELVIIKDRQIANLDRDLATLNPRGASFYAAQVFKMAIKGIKKYEIKLKNISLNNQDYIKYIEKITKKSHSLNTELGKLRELSKVLDHDMKFTEEFLNRCYLDRFIVDDLS